MGQVYLPEIVDGDKRILIINGTPVPYALARIPPLGKLAAIWRQADAARVAL